MLRWSSVPYSRTYYRFYMKFTSSCILAWQKQRCAGCDHPQGNGHVRSCLATSMSYWSGMGCRTDVNRPAVNSNLLANLLALADSHSANPVNRSICRLQARVALRPRSPELKNKRQNLRAHSSKRCRAVHGRRSMARISDEKNYAKSSERLPPARP
jgi:hypothetical protein